MFDARGKLVTPGLINTHAHLYRYAYPIAVDPDAVDSRPVSPRPSTRGPAAPVPSSAFANTSSTRQPLRIYAMLNISTIGNFGNELYLGLGVINPRRPPGHQRASRSDFRDQGSHQRQAKELANDVEVLKRARSAADETGIPIMMHWTNEPELLAILKQGDILTHPFNIPTPNQSNLFGGEPGKVLPQVLELKDRGIWTEARPSIPIISGSTRKPRSPRVGPPT